MFRGIVAKVLAVLRRCYALQVRAGIGIAFLTFRETLGIRNERDSAREAGKNNEGEETCY
jgi:hypothetical protein